MPDFMAELAAVVEILIVLTVVVVIVKRKRSRTPESSSSVIPKPVLRLVTAELEIWRAVWRFLFTRRDASKFYPANRSIFGYLVIFTMVTGPIELFLVHVLIPSQTVAWVVTGFSIYGLFWVAGMYASIRTMPHSFSDERLTLRYGIMAEVIVPMNEIASISARVAKSTKGGDGLRSEIGNSGEMESWITSAGQADVTILLKSKIHPRGLVKRGSPSRVINITVDRPKNFVAAVQADLVINESH
ncbi:MAG: hypothetical protein HOJ22_03110 [Chloroflexi bacterium]|nr:hypothetical protein [Chloroflexota bacterium]MBT5627258.1 hypothetical protein [Chloroflexota bacterium]